MKENKDRKKAGRPLNIKRAKRAQELRAKGLSYREISNALKVDVKNVYDWCQRDSVGKIVDN